MFDRMPKRIKIVEKLMKENNNDTEIAAKINDICMHKQCNGITMIIIM